MCGELITLLSDEGRKAISNILLRGQGLRMAPRDIAKEIRPLIGLTDRQAQANVKYKDTVYQKLLDNGMSESKARERSEAAALRYAGKQHRYRAESIILTENAFAYNRGAHMGVSQSIADGYMGRCEMVWTTAGTNRVCGRCMELKDTVVGTIDQSGVTIPPLHPRCRCAIMYREVGTPRVMQPKPKEYREFKTPDEVNAYFGVDRADVAKPFGRWLSKLTADEEAALVNYTGRGFAEINGLLRGKLKEAWFEEEDLQRLKQTIILIESALGKFELPDNILIYRRVGMRTLFRLKNTEDNVFREKAFTSTSLIQGSFVGDVEVEIKIGKGKGVGAFLEPLSQNHGENEFLLNRGATFKITKIDEDMRKVEMELIGYDVQSLDKDMHGKAQGAKARRIYAQTHSDKFSWEIEDLEFIDEHGNWIHGDEFLTRLNAAENNSND